MNADEAFKEWTQTSGPWYHRISVEEQRDIFLAGWNARVVDNSPPRLATNLPEPEFNRDALGNLIPNSPGGDFVNVCDHGSDPAHCWVCADIRRGNPDPTKKEKKI